MQKDKLTITFPHHYLEALPSYINLFFHERKMEKKYSVIFWKCSFLDEFRTVHMQQRMYTKCGTNHQGRIVVNHSNRLPTCIPYLKVQFFLHKSRRKISVYRKRPLMKGHTGTIYDYHIFEDRFSIDRLSRWNVRSVSRVALIR